MNKPSLLTVLICLLVSIPTLAQRQRSETIRKNVPLDSIVLSDPAILADKATSTYYMTGTGGKLWKSKDLQLWEGPYTVAHTDPKSWMGENPMIWAAELHEYNGKYYYFATFTNQSVKIDTVAGNVIDRRASHILVSDKPDGPYVPMKDETYLPANMPTLDGTFWVDTDGKPYMIYCHEWLQNLNGTMEKIELKPDLSGSVGKGKILFRATDSPWSREKDQLGRDRPNKVTDGPYLFRTQTGRLGMIWTSWIYSIYTQGVAYSESGTLDGPWIQDPDPITPPDYGHGMLFRTFDGKLLMSVHKHHNINGYYRRIPHLFEVDDSGDKLIVGKRFTGTSAQPTDRGYWCNLLYKMAAPVLSNMSEGKLAENMLVEVSPTWDGRDVRVTYMETFGRLMAGLAPWLSLPDDDTAEGKQRKQLREWALKSYANAVNPENPDYLLWRNEGQPLVDAAYIANSFLRAPQQLWEPLDETTKQRYIQEFQQLRRVDTPYTNWLLFSAMVETFLLYADAQYDQYRIHSALRKIEEWYVGDGWYSDGEEFAFDYYNSYVIQTMYVEVLEVLVDKKVRLRDKSLADVEKNLHLARKRMQRFGAILERLISPEGTFPVFGRSITYRTGVLQPLALLALREELPEPLTEGQVRAAMTTVMKRMFASDSNFNEKGYLTLGFAASQPNIADWYTNNGSMYMASLAFLPLGLPAGHSFWTAPAEPWTSKKAWEGMDFPKDKAYRE